MAVIDYQHTLAKPATLAGTSLHTGEKVTLTLKPAPANHGLKFRRIDIEDEPFIDADVRKVQMVKRATTLAEGSIKVHTVEHVISALTGMGVDNAIIEMDANEPPIGDGSAKPYVECIKKAGLEKQDEPREVFEVRDVIHMETPGGSLLTIVPDKKFRISCTQAGPDGAFTQYQSFEITPEIYEKEIAPCRTFVYYEDVKPLVEKGLIKGGSIENAIVIRDNAIMSKEPLRFKDEFVRHKILDIIGDLMLAGRRIMGHVIAVKPSHGANTDLARKLADELAQLSKKTPPMVIPTGKAVMDTEEVLACIPHRPPFLMVDKIVDFEGDKCTGVKAVTMNEDFFRGHFPGHPIMPGVLQLEAIAQVASIVVLRRPEYQGMLGYFMSADNVKWRKPVLPGAMLFIEAEVVKTRKNIAIAKGRCIVNEEVVSEADLKFGLIDR